MVKSTSIEEYGLTVERLRELRAHLGLSIANLNHYYASNKGHLHIITQIESWELGQAVPTFNQLKILIELKRYKEDSDSHN
ncbi:hypothetical protein [Entomospira culicis]|uniref:Uncharacterized protein n=1 Tax=Entomospira culicis TaxID=2719989 RepID=A0A968GGB0_9SPIO|nr:hypothetical protein [Entomospira culicis]NIZ19071.1 hypothetical protein [Entomospira culicis]NIZ69286.1 hypothetical protein [Entomospira culicis]WDI37871.1 hypothetical protein PVA46_03540 [Entomospira culicis]WDI39499.1 hypothetical protein PVA47_03545 [Entomospira culicis]